MSSISLGTFCSEKLQGRAPSCRLSEKVSSNRLGNALCYVLYELVLKLKTDSEISLWKADDQLQRWFKDNDALERALSGEYVAAA